MRHIVYMHARSNTCANSLHPVRCSLHTVQVKCSSTLARSGAQVPTSNQSTNKHASRRAYSVLRCTRSAGSAIQSYAERRGAALQPWQEFHGPVRPRLTLVHLWPLQLGQCICLVICLGPQHSRP